MAPAPWIIVIGHALAPDAGERLDWGRGMLIS